MTKHTSFLTNCSQNVRLGKRTSSLTLNTGVPQGYVLSPLLDALFIYDCLPAHVTNTIVQFADDLTVIGLIMKNDEYAQVQNQPGAPTIISSFTPRRQKR